MAEGWPSPMMAPMGFCGGLRLLTAWSPHLDDMPESLPKYKGWRSFWNSWEHDSLCLAPLLEGCIARRAVSGLSHGIPWVVWRTDLADLAVPWYKSHSNLTWRAPCNQQHIYHCGISYALLQKHAYSYDFSLVLKKKSQNLRMTCSCCLGLFLSLEFMRVLGSEGLQPAAESCLTQTSKVSSIQVVLTTGV